ncbi:MAG: 4Fe-4S dicluster domain-containing protein [Negativicutes bacterium]|nr:4Fe-4S dicluster domain-containing protein [Negativicutes bacterium]
MAGYVFNIRTNWCKACGVCIAFCPKKVLGFDDTGKVSVKNPEACIGCRLCELRCADFAIDVEGDTVG